MPTMLLNAHMYAYTKPKHFGRATMANLYDLTAPKKPTNLSLNSDLLKKARELKVNLSATLEQALNDKLKSVEAEKWKNENRAAVEAYNEFIGENGCLSDEYRDF